MKARQFLDRFGRPVDEAEATDERGNLRDGYAARVSLMMRDGASDDAKIAHALAETEKVKRAERGVRDAVVLDLVNDEAKKAAYAEASLAAQNAWRQP